LFCHLLKKVFEKSIVCFGCGKLPCLNLFDNFNDSIVYGSFYLCLTEGIDLSAGASVELAHIEDPERTDKNDEDKIEYSDLVGALMSSVTTIVNVISYVLIAFVSISLVVSSIMIGIITNISVLERTKEIGILRAIGASKRDVSRVFNAETFIIGLAAGILGIIVTLILCIPANAIIFALTGFANVKAVLPPLGAIILIVISMLLTMIAGLIPARSASKKDPVVALRSE
jgi:putative ABC transport system permease protein